MSSSGDGGTNCSFTSYEQCMMTARGAGAYCVQNPWYLQYGGGQGRPVGQGDRPRRRYWHRPRARTDGTLVGTLGGEENNLL